VGMTSPASASASSAVTNPNPTKEEIRRLRRLPDMGEILIQGEIWTKFEHNREYKVSPNWEEGDYDTGCCWISFEEIDDWSRA
jgi:hypothetical protein